MKTVVKRYEIFSRYVRGVPAVPGVCQSLMNLLAIKTKCLPQLSRHCLVTWDEMSLKRELSYDAAKDRINGLVHLSKQQPKACNQGLVFLVRGLAENWKQPVAFYFSENAASAMELRILLMQVLEALCSIGLLPIATVCDQGSCNQALYRLMKVSVQHPFFEVTSTKVYYCFNLLSYQRYPT